MSNKKRNRKHSKIDHLPPDLKSAVDMMLQGDSTYADVVNFIRDNAGIEISTSAVWRYANGLNATVQELRLIQENMRVISEEMDRHPNLDTSEAISRLLSYQMITALQNVPEEQWQDIKLDKLLSNATALMKAVSYKKGMDIKVQNFRDAAYDVMKEDIFKALAAERPELYRQLAEYINSKDKDDE